MFIQKENIKKIAKLLLEGKIGVMPTDTIYGLHCLEINNALIEKVALLKGRDKNMPMITIISSIGDLKSYAIKLTPFELESIENLWPGPNTLIFDLPAGCTKAFRLPDNKFLIEILDITGPLISTSANKHEDQNANTVEEAKSYFEDTVDFYVNGGKLNNTASNIYKISNSTITQLR